MKDKIMADQNVKIKNNFFLLVCKLGSFLIAVSLILNCRSIWGSITTGSNLNALTFTSLIIGILLSFISVKNISVSKYALNVLLFLSIYIFIYLIQPINNSQLLNIFLIGFSFLFVYLYVTIFSRTVVIDILIKDYINLLVLISIVSLFFWIFGSIFKIIRPTGLVFSNWGAEYGRPTVVNSYYGIYYETQTLNNVIRNSAIFTEAPMASLNFIIAFLFQSLVIKHDKHRLLKEIILILGVLSTMSSTGYIALLIILVMKLFLLDYKNKGIIFPFVFILSVISLIIIHYLLVSKLENASGQTRADDFRAGYEAWKLHPYIGSGLNNNLYQNFMANWRGNNLGFSNTIMDILASGGIYIFALYLISSIYAIITSLKESNINNIIFIIIVVYLFVTTIFTNTYILFFLFIFMVVNSSLNKKGRIE